MNETLMVYYWYGQPLNEIPRELLEEEFCNAHTELEKLRRSECDLRFENFKLEIQLLKAQRKGWWQL